MGWIIVRDAAVELACAVPALLTLLAGSDHAQRALASTSARQARRVSTRGAPHTYCHLECFSARRI